jgi:hypothetical protein
MKIMVLLVLALTALSLPLFAGAVQEDELKELLALKSAKARSGTENAGGVTQTVDGGFMEFTRGELTIRVPLDYGIENAQRIIEMLNGGFSSDDITGKWKASEESGFDFFEFDGPNFIIKKSDSAGNAVQPEPLVYTGTYLFDNNDIILNEITQGENFGVIRITELTPGQELTLQFFPGEHSSEEYRETPIITQKHQYASESDQTAMLCRLWQLVRRDGRETQGTEYDETIRFTKSGTYLVAYPDGAVGLAQWRWKPNSAEQQFEFSWNGNWKEAGIGQIQQLTDSSFKVQQAKEQAVYEFIPAR